MDDERDTPAPGPAARVAAGAPRVADLSALLADLDALRTTLSTDLSLAAAAVAAGARDVAGELVTGDLRALGAFASRCAQRLQSLEAGAVVPRPPPGWSAPAAGVARP